MISSILKITILFFELHLKTFDVSGLDKRQTGKPLFIVVDFGVLKRRVVRGTILINLQQRIAIFH